MNATQVTETLMEVLNEDTAQEIPDLLTCL